MRRVLTVADCLRRNILKHTFFKLQTAVKTKNANSMQFARAMVALRAVVFVQKLVQTIR